MNSYFVALFCVAVAVSPVLSLDCCIPELTRNIQASHHIESTLKQKQIFGTYDVCVVSGEDAARLKSVTATLNNNCLEVGVEYTSGAEGVTRTYSINETDSCTYEQTGKNPPIAFTVYSIYACSRYTIEYGCINNHASPNNHNSERCADKTHFVQCAFPEGATEEDYKDCKDRLDETVGPYIETKIIC